MTLFLLLTACNEKDIDLYGYPWDVADTEYGPLPFKAATGDELDAGAYSTVSPPDIADEGPECVATTKIEVTGEEVSYEGDCDTGWDTASDTASCEEVYNPSEWHWFAQSIEIEPYEGGGWPADANVPAYADVLLLRNWHASDDPTPENAYTAGSACLTTGTCSTGGQITGVDNAWTAVWSAAEALTLSLDDLASRTSSSVTTFNWAQAALAGYGSLSLWGQPAYHNDAFTTVFNMPNLSEPENCEAYNGHAEGETSFSGGAIMHVDWAEPGELMFWAPTDPVCSASGSGTFALFPWALHDIDDNGSSSAAFMLVPTGTTGKALPAGAWITSVRFTSNGGSAFSRASFSVQKHGYAPPEFSASDDSVATTDRVASLSTSGANVISSGTVNTQDAFIATGVRVPSSGTFTTFPTVKVNYACADYSTSNGYLMDLPQGYKLRISGLSSSWRSYSSMYMIVRPDFPTDGSTEAALWIEPEGSPWLGRDVRMSDTDGDGTWDWTWDDTSAGGLSASLSGTLSKSGNNLTFTTASGTCGTGCTVKATRNTLSKYQ